MTNEKADELIKVLSEIRDELKRLNEEGMDVEVKG